MVKIRNLIIILDQKLKKVSFDSKYLELYFYNHLNNIKGEVSDSDSEIFDDGFLTKSTEVMKKIEYV